MRVLLAALVTAALLGVPAADAQTGAQTGVLTGRSLVAAKGCGKVRESLVYAVGLAADGTWSAGNLTGTYSGTSAPLDASGRKRELTFDADSLAAFIATVASDVTGLCGVAVTVTSATKTAFIFKLNGKGTKAKVVLAYAFTGTAGGRSGTAKYRLKLKGPWSPLYTPGDRMTTGMSRVVRA
jgi:hypothetical protein